MTQSQSSAPSAATLSARVLVGGLIAAAVNVALLFGARALGVSMEGAFTPGQPAGVLPLPAVVLATGHCAADPSGPGRDRGTTIDAMPGPRTDAERIRKSLDDIVRFTLALPEAVESTSYGQPALKRGAKLIFALRKDLETLAMVCGFEERATLMSAYPDTFFITDHYLKWPSVVVRLLNADQKVLRAAVTAAWERAGARARKKRTAATRPRASRR